MGQQLVQENLMVVPGDGTAITASTTPTSLLGGLQPVYQMTLPANYLRPGRTIRITASGRISNIVTTPGTLTLDVRLGGVVVANGGAMALNTVAKTNVPWQLEWILQCRANGASGNFFHQGRWTSESVVGSPLPSAGGAGVHMLPNAAPGVGSNVDTTAALALDLFATWSLNNANSIQLHQFLAELLG